METLGKFRRMHYRDGLSRSEIARRPKRDRRTAELMNAELNAQGYMGGYTILTDFIRDWRAQESANAPTRAFVPLKFALGEAFQFDWSEAGGRRHR